MMTYDQIDHDQLTPMMRQYISEKQARPDCLLFFRLGDFYELFFDDALTAARELELALTARDCGLEKKAPMCGVPHHAADHYILKLVNRGYKVAICEQVEDPQTAKGLVKREVVKVITPGTLTDVESLDETKFLYLACVYQQGPYYGFAACDLSSGVFETCELTFGSTTAKLLDELARIQPAELIANQEFASSKACSDLLKRHTISLTVQPDNTFSFESVRRYPMIQSEEPALWASASAALLTYIEETQFQLPEHLSAILPYQQEAFMILDQFARRNLELSETLRDRKRKGSLLWAIDRTRTSMGARLLRHWLEQPLVRAEAIRQRQHAVADLLEQFMLRQELIESLRGLFDLQRLCGRLALAQINARDLRTLVSVLERIPVIRELLARFEDPYLSSLHAQLDSLDDLRSLLERAVADEPPLTIKDGNIIRDGFDQQVDRYRAASADGKQWFLDLETRERDETGIRSLKVGYNRVFGYYIDVTKSNLESVPEKYIRRQTLANSERYITEELQAMEDEILGAEQKVTRLEYDLFCSLRQQATEHLAALKRNGEVLAQLDVLTALAELAERQQYCRPEIHDDAVLSIQGGRHPVVEQLLDAGTFVSNDLHLGGEGQKVMILTGPNMSGKSTYMRQVALIVLLAQIGSFVPADSAQIGIVDQIFTRVGAADDLGGGQSTFMVEMTEVAQIMRQATQRSLLILDEIGRGTSTYDGLSIAWSVIEHVVDPQFLGARTLFATHYHELTDLPDSMSGVFNCHIDVSEKDGEIVFLYQIKDGGSDDSYGIEVARLAGVPDSIVARARELLYRLEQDNQGKRLTVKRAARPLDGQVDLFSAAQQLTRSDQVIKKLKAIDMDYVSPVDARRILLDLIAEAEGKG